MMSLFLWLNELDEGFSHYLTARLLHILEANMVELINFLIVSNDQLLRLDDWHRNGGVITISGSMSLSRDPPTPGVIICLF